MSGRLVLQGGCVLSLDPRVGDLAQADVLIEGDRIAAIGAGLHAAGGDIVDARGMLVLPGFVDTHRHLWEALLHNVGADWSLLAYLQAIYFGTLGARLRPADVYAGNLLGALEALDAGITTLLDWSMINSPEHADEAVRGLADAGIRAVFACGLSGEGDYWNRESGLTHPQDCRRVKARWFSSTDQLLTMGLAIRGPEFSQWDAAVADIRLARELDVLCTMHMGFGPWGAADRSVERLHRAGLLGPDLNFVHGNAMGEDEFRMLGDSGASLSVTPEVEMMMGHGYPATGAFIAQGGRPALGIDVVTSTGGDMFAQMKFALQAERWRFNAGVLAGGYLPQDLNISARQVLQAATMDGARALRLDAKVGSLAPGKQADIVMLRTTDLNLYPVSDPVGAVTQSATTANVDSVFVAGKAVKRGGKLVGVDLDRVRRLAREARDHLYAQGLPKGAHPI